MSLEDRRQRNEWYWYSGARYLKVSSARSTNGRLLAQSWLALIGKCCLAGQSKWRVDRRGPRLLPATGDGLDDQFEYHL